jgi:hypothetical protein
MRRITQSYYFYPIVIFAICIWRIFLAQVPANHGLGWDGYRYYSIAVDGLHSNELESYLVLRIFPCLFIQAVLKLLSLPLDPPHVIMSFKIMNAILIGLSALMVKGIFSQYKLSPLSEFIGFVIVFMNYGLLNFTFYYPVMTDTPTYFLSISLFYFFVRGELLNILLVGLIGAFTWPVLFAMALALILFPNRKVEFAPISKWLQYGMSAACVVYAMWIGWLLVYKNGETTDLAYALPIGKEMLPVTFLGIGLLFFFMPFVLGNKTFFSIQYYKSVLTGNRIFAAVLLLVTFLVVRGSIHVNSTDYMTVYNLIKIHMIFAFARPLTTVVNHFNYFGAGVLLMIVFWKRFAQFISTFGLGVAGAVFVNLFFFSMKPESRAQVHNFPWLLILISLYIGQFNFSKMFYGLIVIINLISAKLWFFFDYNSGNNNILPDGTIDFPDQWFFMNLGMWMTERVWLYMLIATIICLVLLTLAVYKIGFGKRALLFYKKYEPVNHG